jgi:hypothetical protein
MPDFGHAAGARGGGPEPVSGERAHVDLWSADPLGEATRPKVSEPRLRSTGHGRQLIMVHKHFRDELRQIRDAVDQVAAGQLAVAVARSMINDLTVRQNFWALGSFCLSYCRMLTVHHSIEDQALFPELGEKQPSLGPVMRQLEREHEVIAGVLTGLDASLTALVDGGDLGDVRDHVRLLDRLLTSHLDYEEEQLVEPLDRLRLDI